jgi:hypothetical protein
MARQDQIDVQLNQATAAIVCCYLEHMNTAINKGISGATVATNVTNTAGGGAAAIASSVGFISAAELVSLIDSVQGALRTIP